MKHCKKYNSYTNYESLINNLLEQLNNSEITTEEYISNFPMLVYVDDTDIVYYSSAFNNKITLNAAETPLIEQTQGYNYLQTDTEIIYQTGCELKLEWYQPIISQEDIPTPNSVSVIYDGNDITGQVYTLYENEEYYKQTKPLTKGYRHRHTIKIPSNLRGNIIITYTNNEQQSKI